MSIGVIDIAVKQLRQLKAVNGEIVRTSVGDALRDISEKLGTLIKTSEMRDEKDGGKGRIDEVASNFIRECGS